MGASRWPPPGDRGNMLDAPPDPSKPLGQLIAANEDAGDEDDWHDKHAHM